MITRSLIKQLAKELDFDICGVTQTTPLLQNRAYFDEWAGSGYAEPLEYMSRYQDVRFDPSKLIDNGRSIIVCGVNYKNKYSLTQGDSTSPRIASYALNRDYHKTLRNRLKTLLKALQSHHPTLNGRCFTDSAPLLEKQLAVNCGLGWIGRQSLLITPEFGSFVLLGEIVINHEVDSYDSPLKEDRCGECRACVNSCPVGAINNNRTIDTRRCISCRTVEVEDSSDLTLNGWIFGCDECQSCCPHNQRTPMSKNSDFTPIVTPPNSQEWRVINEDEFMLEFGTTPLKRAGIERIKQSLEKI
ncbi:MAG: tRNA epoxyqueuosine(34) reductase QueG [Rikenellaceae bacterium]